MVFGEWGVVDSVWRVFGGLSVVKRKDEWPPQWEIAGVAYTQSNNAWG